MPGFDGTGPQGRGPMTGGGRGFCAVPFDGFRSFSGRFLGRGWNRGGGRGFGRGFGRRWSAYPYVYGGPYYPAPYGAYPYEPELTPQQEADMLRAEAKAMQEEINAINQRVKDLESKATSKGGK